MNIPFLRIAATSALMLGALALPAPALAQAPPGPAPLLCLQGPGGPPSGAAATATQVFSSRFSGMHARAAYSAQATASGHVVETDVALEAINGTSLQAGTGAPNVFSFAFVVIARCDVTNTIGPPFSPPVPLLSLFGCAGIPQKGCIGNVSFQVSNNLASASLTSLNMPLSDQNGVAQGSAAVAANWTGVGLITRSISIQIVHGGGFTFIDHSIAETRNATVSGAQVTQVVGTTTTQWLAGLALVSAELDSVKDGTIVICTGSGFCKG